MLSQVQKLGKAYTKTLNDAGIRTLQELFCTDARRIEVILGRNPPFGNQIRESLESLPRLYVNHEAEVYDASTLKIKATYGVQCKDKSNHILHFTFLALAYRNDSFAEILEHRRYTYFYQHSSVIDPYGCKKAW